MQSKALEASGGQVSPVHGGQPCSAAKATAAVLTTSPGGFARVSRHERCQREAGRGVRSSRSTLSGPPGALVARRHRWNGNAPALRRGDRYATAGARPTDRALGRWCRARVV